MPLPHAPTGGVTQAGLDTAFTVPINDLYALLAPLLADTGWVSMASLTSGWTNDSTPLKARQIGPIVYFQGGVINATFNSTVFTTVATLPSGAGGVTFPPGTRVLPLPSMNGALNRDARLLADGSVQVITSAANGAAFRFDGAYYLTT